MFDMVTVPNVFPMPDRADVSWLQFRTECVAFMCHVPCSDLCPLPSPFLQSLPAKTQHRLLFTNQEIVFCTAWPSQARVTQTPSTYNEHALRCDPRAQMQKYEPTRNPNATCEPNTLIVSSTLCQTNWPQLLCKTDVQTLYPHLHRSTFPGPVLQSGCTGSSPADDHWSLRDSAARLLALVCAKFDEPFYNIEPRVRAASWW